MDSSGLLKKIIPFLSTMTEVNEALNRPYQLQDQDCSLNTFISNIPDFTRDVEAERKMKEVEALRKMRERMLRPKPKEKKRQKVTISDEKEKNCVTTDSDVSGSSGYRSSLSSDMDEMYDVEKMIALDSECRFKREIKEKDEAIIRKAQEKKPRPKNQTAYERDVEILRERQNRAMEEAQIREVMKLPPIEKKKEKAPKKKHVKWCEKSPSFEKEQKIAIKVTENPKEEIVKKRHKCSMTDGIQLENVFGKLRYQDSCKKMTYENKSDSEGIQSEDVNEKRERTVSEKDHFLNRCKQVAYKNLEQIKREEIAKDALEEIKLDKEMAKREFAQKLVDRQEREKKAEMQKSLTNAWDGQVEYKQQKKMAMDRVKKQGSYSLMESERLRRMEETKKKKKEKQQKQSTKDKTEQSIGDPNEGLKSTSAQQERETRLPEKVRSFEDCKKIVYDNLNTIKRKEAANFALLEEKRFQERAKQHLGQKVREEQEKEKKANLKKSLTNTWDIQIQDKKQKKKEKAGIEREQMAAIMESDRLHQIEEVEMRREKKLKDQKFFRQDETEPKIEDLNKTMDDSLEDILRKEAANDARLQKQIYNGMAKENCNKILHKIDRQVKTQNQSPLADKLAARYQCKQKQKSDMGRIERQGVLPGYRAEESRQTKEPHQKLKTLDNVTDHGRNVQYESVLDQDSDCDIPDKDRSREVHKKIVYDQLSHIKKKEANKWAIMEEKILKERKHQEAAAQNREKLEKEKKAAATKILTDSWDSQIRQKQQEKKELRESERKDMLSLIELERVCVGENSKITHIEKHKQPVYHQVWKSLPAEGPVESSSKFCEGRTMFSTDTHDAKTKTRNVSRPLLNHQKVSNIQPPRLPSLNANCVYLHENSHYTGVKLPFIAKPK